MTECRSWIFTRYPSGYFRAGLTSYTTSWLSSGYSDDRLCCERDAGVARGRMYLKTPNPTPRVFPESEQEKLGLDDPHIQQEVRHYSNHISIPILKKNYYFRVSPTFLRSGFRSLYSLPLSLFLFITSVWTCQCEWASVLYASFYLFFFLSLIKTSQKKKRRIYK